MTSTFQERAVVLLAVGMLAAGSGCGPKEPVDPFPDSAQLATEFESAYTSLLDAWYPRTMDDSLGGFLSDFTYDWRAEGPQHKMIVTQSRHVWTTAKAALHRPNTSEYVALSQHGFHFLRDVMWDSAFGGFYQLVTRDGTPIPDPDGALTKTAYGNAFALFGLAAYFGASGDSAALDLAARGFRWLDAHSHDPEAGGYFQFLGRDGTPFKDGRGGVAPKDQNSSIHLLEAFAELYAVWPDEVLRARLEEMMLLIRDTQVGDKAYLTLFSYRDWAPVSYRDSSQAVRDANIHFDHVSFGHDVETAFLLLEAAEVLGLGLDPRTLEIGKQMVDHSLEHGWDAERGGFYDAGAYLRERPGVTIVHDTKAWWAQAEALNTLQLMAFLYPDDPRDYAGRFRTLWTYVNTYLIDHESGDWFVQGLDTAPDARTAPKSQIWKGAYHNARSLARCIERFKNPHRPMGADFSDADAGS